MFLRTILVFFFMLNIGSCSSLLSSAIPNPLEEGKGINTDVQLAQTANMTKKKQLIEATVSSSSNDTNNNNAEEISIENTNITWWLAGLLCLLAGQAIPTRSQYKQITLLKETLEYERIQRKEWERVSATTIGS